MIPKELVLLFFGSRGRNARADKQEIRGGHLRCYIDTIGHSKEPNRDFPEGLDGKS